MCDETGRTGRACTGACFGDAGESDDTETVYKNVLIYKKQ